MGAKLKKIPAEVPLNKTQKSSFKNSLIFATIVAAIFASIFIAVQQNETKKADKVTMDELMAKAQQKMPEGKKEKCKKLKYWAVSEKINKIYLRIEKNY